jgi:hypothetical protein
VNHSLPKALIQIATGKKGQSPLLLGQWRKWSPFRTSSWGIYRIIGKLENQRSPQMKKRVNMHKVEASIFNRDGKWYSSWLHEFVRLGEGCIYQIVY